MCERGRFVNFGPLLGPLLGLWCHWQDCAIRGGMTERAPSKVTKQDINGPDPLTVAFDRWGITPSYLANKLKAELNAKEIKVFHDAERGVDESRPMIAWDIRQRARQDAHKLRGDYPAEKQEHSFPGGLGLRADPSSEMVAALDAAREAYIRGQAPAKRGRGKR